MYTQLTYWYYFNRDQIFKRSIVYVFKCFNELCATMYVHHNFVTLWSYAKKYTSADVDLNLILLLTLTYFLNIVNIYKILRGSTDIIYNHLINCYWTRVKILISSECLQWIDNIYHLVCSFINYVAHVNWYSLNCLRRFYSPHIPLLNLYLSTYKRNIVWFQPLANCRDTWVRSFTVLFMSDLPDNRP